MRTLTHRDPWRGIPSMRDRMAHLFGETLPGFFDEEAENALTATWRPSVDVFEEEDRILLKAELPGMTAEDVEITVANGHLMLKGEKTLEREETRENGHYRRVECQYGAFYRTFLLPSAVEEDKIEAHFVNGVLEIVLAKAEMAKPKHIEVEIK